jgi:hypothetical protein
MISRIIALFRPKPVTVYHVRAAPVDYVRRKRSTTERLCHEIGGPDMVQEWRERGLI